MIERDESFSGILFLLAVWSEIIRNGTTYLQILLHSLLTAVLQFADEDSMGCKGTSGEESGQRERDGPGPGRRLQEDNSREDSDQHETEKEDGRYRKLDRFLAPFQSRSVKITVLFTVVVMSLLFVIQNTAIVSSGILPDTQIISLAGTWQESDSGDSASSDITNLFAENGSSCTSVLPADIPERAVLSINMPRGAISVSVNGVPIYSAWSSDYNNTNTGMLWGDLPEKCGGQTITVWSDEVVGDPSTRLLSRLNTYSELGDRETLTLELIRKNLYAMIFGIFALTMSFLLILMYFWTRRRGALLNQRMFLRFAVFILTAGVWALTDSQIAELFTEHTGIVAVISIITFLLLPILLLQFIMQLHRERVFEILEIIFAVYFFICLLLEFGGIVDIYRSVTLQHILLLITMLILIQYFGKSSWNRNNKAENAVRIGCVIYFLFEIAVILTYVFSRNTSNRLYSIIFVVGVTIQSIFMMRALMFYFSETMQNSIQAETYRSLAYIDVLTGLSNRNAYSKRIEEIEKTAEPSGGAGMADGSMNASSAEGAADHESAANASDIKNLTSKKSTGPVTLIVLDINNLKQTNDI